MHEKGGFGFSGFLITLPGNATFPSDPTEKRERERESEKGEAGNGPSPGPTGIARAGRDERRRRIETAREKRGRTKTIRAEVDS